jgi:hypothetical protein
MVRCLLRQVKYMLKPHHFDGASKLLFVIQNNMLIFIVVGFW